MAPLWSFWRPVRFFPVLSVKEMILREPRGMVISAKRPGSKLPSSALSRERRCPKLLEPSRP